jgi:dihydroxyacid dehydratase/phosphogluconate dehydratase
MAHSVDIEITLKDFQDISDKTPLLADLKPSGKYLMEDLHEAGGSCSNEIFIEARIIAWRLFNSDWKNIS